MLKFEVRESLRFSVGSWPYQFFQFRNKWLPGSYCRKCWTTLPWILGKIFLKVSQWLSFVSLSWLDPASYILFVQAWLMRGEFFLVPFVVRGTLSPKTSVTRPVANYKRELTHTRWVESKKISSRWGLDVFVYRNCEFGTQFFTVVRDSLGISVSFFWCDYASQPRCPCC